MSGPALGHYRPRFTRKNRCEECQNEFATTRRDARLCSARCRQANSRRLRVIDAQHIAARVAAAAPVPNKNTAAAVAAIVPGQSWATMSQNSVDRGNSVTTKPSAASQNSIPTNRTPAAQIAAAPPDQVKSVTKPKPSKAKPKPSQKSTSKTVTRRTKTKPVASRKAPARKKGAKR